MNAAPPRAQVPAALDAEGAVEHPAVLVVEDDPDLAGMLAELLQLEGYVVDVAKDGQRGLHLALTGSYDVLVLDRGLPAIDGLDLLARIRSRGQQAPVLILSALGLPRDRVQGLDAGAEDYLTKPFDVEELLARLRALRRRQLDTAQVLPVPAGRLDVTTRLVSTVDGRSIGLSEREAGLLAVLARRPGRVYRRDELTRSVFPDAESEGVVDTYIHYLRRKLGVDVVRTVRGIGYQLGPQ